MSENSKEKGTMISFRVSRSEYQQILQRYQKSAYRKRSEYYRKVLLAKPVLVKYYPVGLQDYLTEMSELRKELNLIGHNFNQAVRKLNACSFVPELKQWGGQTEEMRRGLMQKVAEISTRLNQLYELWLPK